MRILLVTPWFPTPIAPVSGIFIHRDALLISTQHEVEVVHIADPYVLGSEEADSPSTPQLRVHRVPTSLSRPGDIARAGRRIHEMSEDFDIVHTHAFSALMPFIGRRVRRPWVHSEHWSGVADPATLSPRGRLVFNLVAPQLRRPDMVTAVSSYLLAQVVQHRAGPVMVAPSVVPEATVRSRSPASGTIRLVAVGNLVRGKGPALAIATVEELRRRGFPTTLEWVGDGPLRAELEQSEAVRKGYVSLRGALDADGVSASLVDAEMFLLPTEGETLCLSAIEAIAHGRPVVMGARGGQRDYVTKDNGRLVAVRTPNAYADAVLDARASLGKKSPQSIADTIRGRFSSASVLAGYDMAYRRAIESRLRGRDSPRRSGA